MYLTEIQMNIYLRDSVSPGAHMGNDSSELLTLFE